MKKALEVVKFVWKHRKSFKKFKKELLEVQAKIKEAKKDKKLTKAEIVDILKEADDVFNLLIKTLEEE